MNVEVMVSMRKRRWYGKSAWVSQTHVVRYPVQQPTKENTK